MKVAKAPPGELGDRLWKLIADVEREQGSPPFGEVLLSAMRTSDDSGIGVAAERQGELQSYAFAAPNPDGQVWTLELADASGDFGWVLDRVLEILASEGMYEIVLWVHTADLAPPPGLVTLERALHRMVTDLPVTEGGATPAGVVIRGFDAGRERSVLLELNNRAFEGHPEQGGWTDRDLERRLTMPWFDPDGVRTAWIDGRMVAFNWTKVHETPAPDGGALGEIYAIGVDPRYQGRALGRAIALDGLRYLSADRGATRAILYVDASNTVAMNLYRRLGFASEHVDLAYRWVRGQ